MTERFVTVSREKFFSVVGPRDILVKAETDHTIWEFRDRRVIGRSTPGWRNPSAPKSYSLRADYVD